MIFDFLYAACWIFLLFLGLRSTLVFKKNTELNQLTAYGFVFKSIVIIVLMLVFQTLSPSANLFIDTKAYMRDAEYLHQVFAISPTAYLRLLTGIGETNELVLKYLGDTYLWDKGVGLYNDSKNVVRFNSLIYFVSRGNVFIHVVFMCLISTAGIRFLVLAFKNYVEAYKLLFFIFLFLLPSIFISTGGILKEPFLILGMGFFLNGIFSDCNYKWKWFRFILGLLILISIKPYVLLLLLLGFSFLIFSQWVIPKKLWISSFLFIVFLLTLFLTIQPVRIKTIEYISRKQLDMERICLGGLYTFENKENPRILFFPIEVLDKLEIKNDSIQIVATVIAKKSTFNQWEDFREVKLESSPEKWKIHAYFPYKANSFFQTKPLRNSFSAFVLSAPEAFFNGLLRPFPADLESVYTYPAMLETWFCIGIAIYALFHRKKLTVFEKRMIGSLLLFIVTTLLLVGYTTPVVGALVRYRIPAYIALIVISFIIFKIPKKWKKQIQ